MGICRYLVKRESSYYATFLFVACVSWVLNGVLAAGPPSPSLAVDPLVFFPAADAGATDGGGLALSDAAVSFTPTLAMTTARSSGLRFSPLIATVTAVFVGSSAGCGVSGWIARSASHAGSSTRSC